MNYWTLTLFIIIFLLGCKNTEVKKIKSADVEPLDHNMIHKVTIEIKTDLGLVKKSQLIYSTKIGSRHEVMGKVGTYSTRFENGEYFTFSSSKGILKIRCNRYSDYGTWDLMRGGVIILDDGKRLTFVSNLGSAGKSFDNKAAVSQKFLESSKALEKYGFRFISHGIKRIY